MKLVSQTLPFQTALDFGIIFLAMNIPSRNDVRKREREDKNGGQEEDNSSHHLVEHEECDYYCGEEDSDEEAAAADCEADILMGQNLVTSIKGLMESNKRLKTANSQLKQDIKSVADGLKAASSPPRSSLRHDKNPSSPESPQRIALLERIEKDLREESQNGNILKKRQS